MNHVEYSAQDRVDHGDASQLDDLISEQRGLFELEIARSRFHLTFELLDHANQFITWDLGDDSRFATSGIADVLLRNGADAVRDVFDFFDDAAGHDAVSLVVRDLQSAAPVGLVNRRFHRPGHGIGVHDHLPVDVAGRPSNRLNERAFRAQEAFLVRVEDGHQRDLGQVETLAQKVDADDDIVNAKSQVAQNLHPFQRVDLTVQVV